MRFLSIIVLAFLLVGCKEAIDPVIINCDEFTDLGFVAFAPPDVDLFLYENEAHQQLIFKNTNGDSTGFYAVVPYGRTSAVVIDTVNQTNNRRCDNGEYVTYSYEQESYSISYKAAWSNRAVGFNVKFLAKQKYQGFDPLNPDEYDYFLRLIVTNNTSAVMQIKLEESYSQGDLLAASSDWTVHYQDIELAGTAFKDVFVCRQNTSDFTLVYSLERGIVAFVDDQGEQWAFHHYRSFPLEQAYNFTLYDDQNNEVQLYEQDGELYLLDFWASWCTPCIDEIENFLKPLHEEYADDGLTIISISIDQDELAWQDKLEELQMPWVQLISSGGFASPLLLNYEVYGIPTIYALDDQWTILSNELRKDALRDFVVNYFD